MSAEELAFAAAKKGEALFAEEEALASLHLASAFLHLASALLRLAFAAEACGLGKRFAKFAGYL